MAVAFTDDIGSVEIVQELELIQFLDGSWGYEGSNVVWADDLITPATFYSPDVLLMIFGADGFWYLDQVCNEFYGCGFINIDP